MESKPIRVTMHIKASPEEVYRALTNSFAIELWSGEPAQMEAVAGSEFSLWNGDIVGKNIEFVENEMIVQQWYFDEDENMPPSIASIRLFEDKNQTRVEVIHENVPEEARENIYEGWKFNYLGAVRAFFEN